MFAGQSRVAWYRVHGALLLCCFGVLVSQPVLSQVRDRVVEPRLVSPAPLTAVARNRFAAVVATPVFEANVGQADESARYVLRGRGYSMLFGDDSFVAAVFRSPETRRGDGEMMGNALRFTLVGAERTEITPLEPATSVVSVVKGSDRNGWHSAVPAYERLVYPGVYPGVDFFVQNAKGPPEFGFILEPDADVDRVVLAVGGASGLTVTRDGDLEIMTSGGPVRLGAPQAFEEVAGGTRQIPVRFVLHDDERFGFSVGRRTPGSRLVIDPPVIFAAYIGGSGFEDGGIHYSSVGPLRAFVDLQFGDDAAAYIVSNTGSADFPFSTLGELTSWNDVIVLKLSTQDQSLVYATVLGGRAASHPTGIAPTADGSAYVSGWTRAEDFPSSPGVIHETREEGGGFLLRLSPDGSFDIGTLLGSAPDLYPNAVRLTRDADGKEQAVYVAGAVGHLAPGHEVTAGAFQTSTGGGSLDGFVARLNPGLTGYDYFTLLGGGGDDVIHDIAVLGETAFVVGTTSSFDFPISSAFVKQPTHSATGNHPQEDCIGTVVAPQVYTVPQPSCFDGFIARLGPDGNELVFSTYHGTRDGADALHGLGLVPTAGNPLDGTVVATGRTTAGESQSSILIARATGLGSPGPDGADFVIPAGLAGNGARVAVDGQGGVHVVGSVTAAGLAKGAQHAQQHHGHSDMFYMRIPPGSVTHDFFTYLGGSAGDWGSGIDTLEVDDRNFCVAVAGHSFSTDVGPPIQGQNSGGTDVLVFGLCPGAGRPPEIRFHKEFIPATATAGQPVIVRFTVTSNGPTTLRLLDSMPEGLAISGAPAYCTFAPLSCDLSHPGGSMSFDVTLRVVGDPCGSLRNEAQLMQAGVQIASATDTLSVPCRGGGVPAPPCGRDPACTEPLVCGLQTFMVEECVFPSLRVPSPWGMICLGGAQVNEYTKGPYCMPASEADIVVTNP